jgi:NADH dehydrogenase FAD-containing subunit
MLQEKQFQKQQDVQVVIVGGGAAGIELSMSIWGRWTPIVGEHNIHVTLLDAGNGLMPNEPAGNRDALKQLLHE